MTRIAAIATIAAAEGKEAELQAALLAHFPEINAEPGTLVYALHRRTDDPGTFVFYELYQDRQAATLHSQSDAAFRLQGALEGLTDGPPAIVVLEPINEIGLPG